MLSFPFGFQHSTSSPVIDFMNIVFVRKSPQNWNVLMLLGATRYGAVRCDTPSCHVALGIVGCWKCGTWWSFLMVSCVLDSRTMVVGTKNWLSTRFVLCSAQRFCVWVLFFFVFFGAEEFYPFDLAYSLAEPVSVMSMNLFGANSIKIYRTTSAIPLMLLAMII